MSDLVTQIETLATEVQSVLTTAQANDVPAAPTAAEKVLEAVVVALQAEGYTVSAPEVETPAEDAPETTEENPNA